MDAVLEPTKQKVLDTKKMLDKARITEQRAALCDAAGQAFYNTSKFTLRDLKSRGIELLREYRFRLVADVVTGKLDVREAAARLPEEAAPATADAEYVGVEDEPADEDTAA